MSDKTVERKVSYEDAVSKATEIIGPQLAGDANDVVEGIVDVRRFSRVNKIEVTWMSYFSNIPLIRGGRYAKKIVIENLNLLMSLEGHERSKLLVKALGMLTGVKTEPKKDTRNVIEKYITKRGQKPEEEE